MLVELGFQDLCDLQLSEFDIQPCDIADTAVIPRWFPFCAHGDGVDEVGDGYDDDVDEMMMMMMLLVTIVMMISPSLPLL